MLQKWMINSVPLTRKKKKKFYSRLFLSEFYVIQVSVLSFTVF